MKRLLSLRLIVLVAALAWAGHLVRAGAELVLLDGTVLSGTDVERTRGGDYQLTIAEDNVVSIPVGLVAKIRLTGGEDPAPTAFKITIPENLVGPKEPFEPPKTRDQLASFGRAPATFREGSVRTDWTPGNALAPDATEFHPVRWRKGPTDFNWTPTSAFRASQDVTQFSPAKWRVPMRDPSWYPVNGFRPSSRWFE